MPQIISANRLRDGRIVFLDPQGNWVESVDEAAHYVSPDETALALTSGQAGIKANLVVDVAPIDIAEEGGLLRPARLRDAIRVHGPTIAPGERLSPPRPAPSREDLPDVSI